MQWSKLVPEFTVADFSGAVDFYTEILGFRIVHQRQNPNFVYLAHLDQEAIQIMLEEHHQNVWRTAELQRPFGRGINFQIELDDIGPLCDRLQAAKYPLYRGIADAWRDVGTYLCGDREFLVQDLDGYLLRFSQPLGERAKSP